MEFRGAVVKRFFGPNCTLLEPADSSSLASYLATVSISFCRGHPCLHASQHHDGQLGRTGIDALDGSSFSGGFCRTGLCLLRGRKSMNEN